MANKNAKKEENKKVNEMLEIAEKLDFYLDENYELWFDCKNGLHEWRDVADSLDTSDNLYNEIKKWSESFSADAEICDCSDDIYSIESAKELIDDCVEAEAKIKELLNALTEYKQSTTEYKSDKKERRKITVTLTCDEYYVVESLHYAANVIEDSDKEYEEIGTFGGCHYTAELKIGE